MLLFEDAETLSSTTFRYLQFLLKLLDFGRTKLRLVLLGEPGSWPGLEDPDLQTLRQAAVSKYLIQPLEPDEAKAYLGHKLRSAGQSRQHLMTRSAHSALLAAAGGMPARLDALAEQALARRHQSGRKRVTSRVVRQLALQAPFGTTTNARAGALPIMPPPRSRLRPMVAAGLTLFVVAGTATGFGLRQFLPGMSTPQRQEE